MKLCSRLLVLYCRSCPKDDKSTHFDSHFEEVRDGVEPWLIARWNAHVEFLLSVIELLFLSLTVEAPQGKTCQDPNAGPKKSPKIAIWSPSHNFVGLYLRN